MERGRDGEEEGNDGGKGGIEGEKREGGKGERKGEKERRNSKGMKDCAGM